MERKEFIRTMLYGSAALVAASCLGACGAKTPPENVNLTLDMSTPEYAPLQKVGGFIRKDDIVIARVAENEYIALSGVCTHMGGKVEYQKDEDNFICHRHGSKFNDAGGVIKGPAKQSLRKYNVSVMGNSIKIMG